MTTPLDSSVPQGHVAARNVVRALADTNVAIDLILARQPWLVAAQPLWDARDGELVVTYLHASVVTDIFYIVRRQANITAAFAAIDHVLDALGILTIDAALAPASVGAAWQ